MFNKIDDKLKQLESLAVTVNDSLKSRILAETIFTGVVDALVTNLDAHMTGLRDDLCASISTEVRDTPGVKLITEKLIEIIEEKGGDLDFHLDASSLNDDRDGTICISILLNEQLPTNVKYTTDGL